MAKEQGLFSRRNANNVNINKDYNSGDINTGELILRQLGNTAGMLGDIAAVPLEAAYNLLPDSAQDTIEAPIIEAIKYLGNTDTGKQLAQLAKDNPRAAKNMMAALDTAGVLPMGKIMGSAANKLLRNTHTEMKGGGIGTLVDKAQGVPAGLKALREGYGPRRVRDEYKFAEGVGGVPFYSNPFLKPIAFGGEVMDAIPGTLKDTFWPPALAKEQALRVGSNRLKEMRENKKFTPGSAAASNIIDNQSVGRNINTDVGGTSPALGKGPLIKKNFIETNLDWDTQKKGIEKHLFPEGMPEKYKARIMSDIQASHIGGSGKTQVGIKRPSSESIGFEASGARSTGNIAAKSLFSEKSMSTYLKDIQSSNDVPSANQYVEFMQIGNAMDKMDVLEINKKLGKSKKDSLGPVAITRNVATVRAKLANGQKLNKVEKKIFDAWDTSMGRVVMTKKGKQRRNKFATVKDDNGNVVSNSNLSDINVPEGSSLYQGGSHHSSTKELGGVHDTMIVDPMKHEMWNTISDGHDMFNLNPIGGHAAITIVPTQKVNLRSSSASKNRVDSDIHNRNRYDTEHADMEEIEKITGVPIQRKVRSKAIDESGVAYHNRALQEAKFPVTARTLGKLGSNVAKTGFLGTQLTSDDPNGMFGRY